MISRRSSARCLLLLAIAIGGGCRSEGVEPGVAPESIVRLTPRDVSALQAWTLFDRSVSTGLVLENTPATLRVGLGGEQRVAAIKIFGPCACQVDVRGPSGASLLLDGALDLSAVPRGWSTFALNETTVAAVDVVIDPAEAGMLPELEIWAATDSAVAVPPDLTAPSLPSGFLSFAAEVQGVDVEPKQCVSYPITLDLPPSQFRRAHLTYETTALRPFALARTINDQAEQGGAWMPGDGKVRGFAEEIDPSVLGLGDNEVRLCVPMEASGPVTIADVRIVGELDLGTGLITSVEGVVGGGALLDADPGTSVAVLRGQELRLSFDRLTSPDAVLLDGDSNASAEVACIDLRGASRPLHARRFSGPSGTVVQLDGGAAACAKLGLTFSAATTISRVDVVGSGAADAVDWPRLSVTSVPERFGDIAWISGFVARPSVMHGAVRISVDQAQVEEMTGDFGQRVSRRAAVVDPWSVTVNARMPDGSELSRTLVLATDHADQLASSAPATSRPGGTSAGASAPSSTRFGNEGDVVVERATPTSVTPIRLGTHIGVDVPRGAVARPTDITVRHLGTDVLPPLDPGMINVTAPAGRGYEFLPHGQKFLRKVEVVVPFDPALIPEGMSAADVFTFYFDPVDERWKKLDRAAIDVGDNTTKSVTDHFTIMINAVLTVPKNPSPLSLDPTALTSIGAASPAANIDLVEPPSANSTGDARTGLPIRLPPGRGNYSPSLGLSYSSAAGNGWLGVGWELSVSRVEIDTRWGVPTYASSEEPRYLIDGGQIVPTLESEGPGCADGSVTRRYHARIEGAFAHILRCGDAANNYHWEIRDRDGTLYVYGASSPSDPSNASLRGLTPAAGIYRWNLRKVVDVYGNTTSFRYHVDDDLSGAEPGRDLYPAAIEYTSHASLPAAYSVEFNLDDASRPDRIISGRAGFKMTTRRLLRSVRVKFRSQIVREYVLTYGHGQFDKSVLSSVAVYGVGGCAAGTNAFAPPACAAAPLFHEHSFDYFTEPQRFGAVVAWGVSNDPDPEHAALGRGRSEALSGSVGLTVSVPGVPVSGSGNLSGSTGGRGEFVGMYDVNGDGLTDQVFDTGTSIEVIYNRMRPGIDPSVSPLFAATGEGIAGLPALGIERHGSWGVDGNISVGPGSLSAGFSSSGTRSRQFLSDLNGDGFLDLVRADGTSLLGHRCPTGTCFAPTAFAATTSIDPQNDPFLVTVRDDLATRLFTGDPVVQWVAPFSGTISINGTAQKRASGGSDGVLVEVYHQDDLLEALPIAASDASVHTFPTATTVDVDAGEAVYLRVRTGNDDGIALDGSLRDAVDARLDVTYTHACTVFGCGTVTDPHALRDPSGASIFAFSSQGDFRIAGQPAPIVALAEGTIGLNAVLLKNPTLADLRVCVQRFASVAAEPGVTMDRPCSAGGTEVANVSGTLAMAAGSTTPLPLSAIVPVQLGELIIVRVESDLSFDPAAVALEPALPTQPLAAYTEVCLPDEDGTQLLCTTDPAAIANVPLRTSHVGAFVPVAADPPSVPFLAPESGTLFVDAIAAPTEPFLFAVRSDRQGILWIADCTAASCGSSLVVPGLATDTGESITFELVSASGLPLFPSSLDVFYTAGNELQAPLNKRRLDAESAQTPFAGGHRQWRAAFWNDREPFEPARLLDDLESLPLLPAARLEQISRSLIPPRPAFAGTTITSDQPAWVGPFSAAFVSAGSMHAATIGVLGEDDDPAAGAGVFAGNYVRLSGTTSFYFGAGLQLVPGFSFDLRVSRSNTDTTTDVLDMNGDGIGDIATANAVRLGALSTSPLGAGETFLDPGGNLRHRVGREYAIGFGGGRAVKRTTTSLGRTLSVDNEAGPDKGFLGLSGGVGLGIGRSQTTKDMIDLNGDGLPDLVRRDGALVRVRLNLGTRFGAEEVFGSYTPQMLEAIDGFEDDVERADLLGFSLDSTSDALQHETTVSQNAAGGFNLLDIIDFTYSRRFSSTRTSRQVADVNGDGLPDLLYKRDGEPEMRVQLNRGGDFAPMSVWATGGWPIPLSRTFSDALTELVVTGPDVLASTGVEDGTTYSARVRIPLPFVQPSFGGSTSKDRDSYELALLDVDGDGTADHVLRKGRQGDAGTIYVKRNLVTGKANLLRTIHRPLGGTVTLEFARAGNTVDMPDSREVLTRVEVDDGVDLGPSFESPNLVTTISYSDGFFHRGEKEFFGFARVTTRRADGVSVEDTFENATYPLHGQVLRQRVRDVSNRLFQEKTWEYDVRPVVDGGGDTIGPDPTCLDHLHPLLGADACVAQHVVVTREDDTRAEGGIASKTRTLRDLSHDRFGHVLTSHDTGDGDVANDDIFASATYQNDVSRWILGRPSNLHVRAGGAVGTLLRSRSGTYNAQGDVTHIHVATGSGTASTVLTYDEFGNTRTVTTPPNESGQAQTVEIGYDADTAMYPVTTTDGFGYVSTAEYDVRFGEATTEVDVNGARLARGLDAFGRVVTVHGPYDLSAPGIEITYHAAATPPRAVTITRSSAPADYSGPLPPPLTTVTVADGLGRAIELRKTAVVNAIVGMTTSGLVARDAVGRVVRTQHPFFTPGASSSFVAPQVTPATTVAYDVLDRPVLTTFPDGANEQASFDVVPDADGTLLFLARSLDPNGHARESFFDHSGRMRSFVEHPTAASASVTRYDYLATGELSRVVDAEGNATLLGYDQRGLRTSFQNGDYGLIEERFDLMGNRVALIEPNHRALGVEVKYGYERDRLTTIDYPSKPDVSFAYGGPGSPFFGAGRIVQVIDETGAQEHSYGALGEMRRTVRTVDTGQAGRSPIVFDLRLTTDSMGRQLRIGYPNGEVVTNTYDASGLLQSVGGTGAGWSRTYVEDVRYDVFENRIRARFGNGVVTSWAFEPARVRLASIATTLPSATKIQDLRYAYDSGSNPIQIDNVLAPLAPNSGSQPAASTLTLTYDGVDRLTRAVGQTSLTHNKSTTYDQTSAYSASHNLTHKQRAHIIATPSGIPQAPSATNFSSPYSYTAERPHLPSQVGTVVLTYDPSGNPVTRREQGTNSQEILTWDDDGRMVEFQKGGAHQRNRYDAEGNRVVRRGTQNETIFASEYFDLENGTQGVKHVFMGDVRLASEMTGFQSGTNPTAPSSPGTAYFFHHNHLGSTAVLTAQDGTVHSSLEYFVDGETWVDRGPSKPINGYSFTGKPFDPETGFYDFGQRFYDPRTSLWQGVDAAVQTAPDKLMGRPGLLATSVYAEHNPIRYVDPDGLEVRRPRVTIVNVAGALGRDQQKAVTTSISAALGKTTATAKDRRVRAGVVVSVHQGLGVAVTVDATRKKGERTSILSVDKIKARGDAIVYAIPETPDFDDRVALVRQILSAERLSEAEIKSHADTIASHLRDVDLHYPALDISIVSVPRGRLTKGNLIAVAGHVIHEGVGHRAIRDPSGGSYHSDWGVMRPDGPAEETLDDIRFAGGDEARLVNEFFTRQVDSK